MEGGGRASQKRTIRSQEEASTSRGCGITPGTLESCLALGAEIVLV